MRTDAVFYYAGLGLATIFTLPACALTHAARPAPNFGPGPTPQNHAVFCDIEVMGTGFENTSRQCADALPPSQVQQAIPLTSAALALNTGQTSMTALDKSSDAVGRCGSNGEIVLFHGPFPQGVAECLNCGAQIPSVYPDGNAVCRAVCADISVTPLQNPPSADVAAFCAGHAHVSTNVPASGCPTRFATACTDAGSLSTSFDDPRIPPQPVVWTQLSGVGTRGSDNNGLTMTGPTDPGGAFTAQAVSSQTVTGGDAYVEFSAGETNLAHVIGFQQISGCPPSCTDGDPTPNDINFALRLGVGGLVFVSNLGTLVNGPGLNGSLETYQTTDRFRITLTDLNNGSFSVVYSKVIGACTQGMPCNLSPFYTDPATGTYPVRLDTSFRDNGAQLTNVTLVWIQPPL